VKCKMFPPCVLSTTRLPVPRSHCILRWHQSTPYDYVSQFQSQEVNRFE